MAKKTIINLTLIFTTLGFLTGAIAFTIVDLANKKQRDNLLQNGVKTTAIVKSKTRKSNRQMSAVTFKWQYITNYYVSFAYAHDNIARENKTKNLNDYLNKTQTQKADPKDKIKLTRLTDKPIYNNLNIGNTIEVIYLFGQPESAQMLNNKGGVTIPKLLVFAFISLLLFIASFLMWLYFKRTGKTL